MQGSSKPPSPSQPKTMEAPKLPRTNGPRPGTSPVPPEEAPPSKCDAGSEAACKRQPVADMGPSGMLRAISKGLGFRV